MAGEYGERLFAVRAVGNRGQFRVGQEPLDQVRRYLALYMKGQAYCHFSDGLISNLERYWNAQSRKSSEASSTRD